MYTRIPDICYSVPTDKFIGLQNSMTGSVCLQYCEGCGSTIGNRNNSWTIISLSDHKENHIICSSCFHANFSVNEYINCIYYEDNQFDLPLSLFDHYLLNNPNDYDYLGVATLNEFVRKSTNQSLNK